jgi:uncharacterized protein (TIGR02246 family)
MLRSSDLLLRTFARSIRIREESNVQAITKRTGLIGVFAVLAATVALPANALARTAEACQTITRQQVIGLFDRWNQALATRKVDQVVATYAPDATLLPTVQNGPLIGPEAIGGYFTHFLKLSPQATIETRVIHTGCNVAYDIGLYTFMVDGDQPNTRRQEKARYTFIYAPVHGKWLIVHHHSSSLPVPSP